MNATTVIHVSDMPNHPGAIYVGRRNARYGLPASRLANPYRIGGDGDRNAVVDKYDEWAEMRIRRGDRDFVEALIACRDQPISCWCRRAGEAKTPENACHADIIAGYLDRYTDDELRAMATAR